ncbi:hypothetical protein [Tsukamurella sp. 1534]|uniref:hypothetical protein n=1 Tax=Tsukamurella sp. 1534 TaxID=1151061 RepID=UPI000302CFD7|nr:hypothetical protein [Tsukamurella sp. 1534]
MFAHRTPSSRTTGRIAGLGALLAAASLALSSPAFADPGCGCVPPVPAPVAVPAGVLPAAPAPAKPAPRKPAPAKAVPAAPAPAGAGVKKLAPGVNPPSTPNRQDLENGAAGAGGATVPVIAGTAIPGLGIGGTGIGTGLAGNGQGGTAIDGIGVPGPGLAAVGTGQGAHRPVQNPTANVPSRPANPGRTIPDGALGIPVVPGVLGVPLWAPQPCDPARVTTCPDSASTK